MDAAVVGARRGHELQDDDHDQDDEDDGQDDIQDDPFLQRGQKQEQGQTLSLEVLLEGLGT